MYYTSFLCRSDMLGECVELLASAHQRVAKAKFHIQRYEDLRRHPIQTDQVETAFATMPDIKNLLLDLQYSEAMVKTASQSVRRAFDLATAHNAPSVPSYCSSPPMRCAVQFQERNESAVRRTDGSMSEQSHS